MAELHDTAPAIISEHAHVADPWWERCRICGLGAAAHTQTDSVAVIDGPYRCIDCVTKNVDPCPHQEGRHA